MIFIFRLNKKTLKLFESFDGMHFFVDEILLNIYNEFFDQSVHFSTLRLSTIFFFFIYRQYSEELISNISCNLPEELFSNCSCNLPKELFFQYLQYLKKKINRCNKLAAVQKFQFSGYFFHRIFLN